MTSHPNTTTDGPDALTDDSPDMETATAEDDAPVTPPPAESPPARALLTKAPLTNRQARPLPTPPPGPPGPPPSRTTSQPKRALATPTAAAAAAALFGDDALPDAASGNAADGISAAEREYQEAMRTAQALGFDEEAPTAAIDAEAASAAELAERLGLEESKEPAAPPEPEPEDVRRPDRRRGGRRNPGPGHRRRPRLVRPQHLLRPRKQSRREPQTAR